jgi:hypothetical protein
MWDPTVWKIAAILLLVGLCAAAIAGNAFFRIDIAASRRRLEELDLQPRGMVATFDLAMLNGLPEVAIRYFTHAIAPGTPLLRDVRLDMHGTFVLGTGGDRRQFDMQAEQVLQAPTSFIWLARLRSGFLEIRGYDLLLEDGASTHFWIKGLFPVARLDAGQDFLRSARARPAIESIWAPAALLPANGALWVQTGANRADVTLPSPGGEVTIRLSVTERGAIASVETTRWSDANERHRFMWQSFGGIVTAEATFDGFTIPSAVEVGNNLRAPGYFPFFITTVDRARFGPASEPRPSGRRAAPSCGG